jgi:signal transduction histidine kinase/YHS domain-containing protein
MNQYDWLHIGLAALVMFLFTNVWLVYRVLRPIRRLSVQTTRLANGDLTAFQEPLPGIQEVGVLRRTMASMAGHVRRTHEEGAAYRYALTDGQEGERRRIAHELHDDTVQSLVSIAQSIDLALQWLERNPDSTVELLRSTRAQAIESVSNLRRLIANLRPPALEELGLIAALRMLVQSETQTRVEVNVSGGERRLSEAHELALFRVAQEAIQNALRHSQARHVTVQVEFGATKVTLTIHDDGCGFQLPQHLDCFADAGHYGVLGMRERVQQLNGTFHVLSVLERGTQIRAVLPIERVAQPAEAVQDPVCGASIQPEQAYGSVHYAERLYYFCCPVCQGAFQQDPHLYLSPDVSSNSTAKA